MPQTRTACAAALAAAAGGALAALALRAMGRRGRASPARALRRRALCLGDSITEMGLTVPCGELGEAGFVARIGALISRKVDITLRGFSGYNSRMALAVLPFALADFAGAAEPPLFATVQFGANDAAGAGSVPNEQQHVPLEEYGENLGRIVQRLKALGCEHIIVIGPPPVDTERWKDRTNETVQRYNTAAQCAAERHGARFVDLFSALLGTGEWMNLTYDGLHLNGRGSRVLQEAVMAALPADLPQATPGSLPFDLPFFMDLPSTDPALGLSKASVQRLSYPCRLQHL
mmetsp:Transcript_99631/g.277418  ORF Transcript_99631/g.277418 Transcript_99631/m.277418 type:complete len:289 (-) Transcript_99631:105-971(-)